MSPISSFPGPDAHDVPPPRDGAISPAIYLGIALALALFWTGVALLIF
ncbi:hypothetical protein [Sphingomonas sp. IW22]